MNRKTFSAIAIGKKFFTDNNTPFKKLTAFKAIPLTPITAETPSFLQKKHDFAATTEVYTS